MPDGTVLAFDFGTQRIGVALGETLLGQARPLTVITAAANDARFTAIGKLIAEWQPTLLVVGLPLRMDGAEHDMSVRCRRFAHQLEGRFRLPVELVDERLSSADAEAGLGARGMDWRTRKDHLDAAAAAILLQNFFDTPVTAPLAIPKP